MTKERIFHETMTLANRTEVTVSYRRKDIRYYRLRVGYDAAVAVSYPRSGSLAQAQAFVRAHEELIMRRMAQLDLLDRTLYIHDCLSFQRVWLFGVLYQIRFTADPARDLTRDGGVVYFSEKRTDMHQALRDLRAQELPRLMELFNARAERFQVFSSRKPAKLSFKEYAARWGSCRPSTGEIILNTRLVHVPWEESAACMDHELCHLVQANHGAAFHRLLEEVHPGAHEAQERLDQYAFVLSL